MDADRALRNHLVALLTDSHAHVDLLESVASVPARVQGARPAGAPHTPWQLLEHIRIAQWDILEFSRTASHESPAFPDGYWPPGERPPSADAWRESVARITADLEAMAALVESPATDLFARIPHGDGQTILREALLVADHNGYHLGQLVLLLRQLGAWTGD
jgi:uncharacterized damage-inducible protein DinB